MVPSSLGLRGVQRAGTLYRPQQQQHQQSAYSGAAVLSRAIELRAAPSSASFGTIAEGSVAASPRPAVQPYQPQYYPGIEEEEEVSHSAFHRAYDDAKPEVLRVPGLQEFAAALWQRRSSIPSPSAKDPLLHIFDEFDMDSDGVLDAAEIAQALCSHNVDVNEQQVQWYIQQFEGNKSPTIARHEFPQFMYSMAVADLTSHPQLKSDSVDSCDLP